MNMLLDMIVIVLGVGGVGWGEAACIIIYIFTNTYSLLAGPYTAESARHCSMTYCRRWWHYCAYNHFFWHSYALHCHLKLHSTTTFVLLICSDV